MGTENEYIQAVKEYQVAVKTVMDIASTTGEAYRQSLQVLETAREKMREARAARDAFREPKTLSVTHA